MFKLKSVPGKVVFLASLAAMALPLAAQQATTPVVVAPAAALPEVPAPPPVPLGVAMTANTAESITLSWYRPSGEVPTAYHVYQGTAKEGPFQRVLTVTERTATVKGLKVNTPYFFNVTAVYASGESGASRVADAFTIKPAAKTGLPVRIAKNMCVSLGAQIVSTPAPTAGTLANLVDGSEATTTTFGGPCEVRVKLNPQVPIEDAGYLLLNFRTDSTGQSYAYNINWRALKDYVITESMDSTDGTDGTWTEVLTGTNKYLDGVVVIPNHKAKWIGVKNSGSMQLCRLDLFRGAPEGYRNDYWIFTGDSLVAQDIRGGGAERGYVWFSDLVRQQYPDRYPIVVNSSQGGEMMANTIGRMRNFLPVLSAPNGTKTPTGTFVCFESGFNDIGLSAGLWIGSKINKSLTEAKAICEANGVLLVPVRLEYSTGYLNTETLEPNKYNLFHNTLAANLAGVDTFARNEVPWAVDPATQLPYADYWTFTRQNYAAALAKDGVHHTKEGSDGINRLWAVVAGKMAYKN